VYALLAVGLLGIVLALIFEPDVLIVVGFVSIVVALILAPEVRRNKAREEVGALAFVGIAALVAYFLFG